jgi:hypothetical protein
MIDTNGFLGWMVGSNVYYTYTREVTPAKWLVHEGKCGIAAEMKAFKGFLSQYFSLFEAFSALYSALVNFFRSQSTGWKGAGIQPRTLA